MKYILLPIFFLTFLSELRAQEELRFLFQRREIYHRFLFGLEGHTFVPDPKTKVTTYMFYPGLTFAAEIALDQVFDRAIWFLRPKIGASHKFVYGEAGLRVGKDLNATIAAMYLYHFDRRRILFQEDNNVTVWETDEFLKDLYVNLGVGYTTESYGIEATVRFVLKNTITVTKPKIETGSPLFGTWRHGYMTVTFWLAL